jgi:hypothetical protein
MVGEEAVEEDLKTVSNRRFDQDVDVRTIFVHACQTRRVIFNSYAIT